MFPNNKKELKAYTGKIFFLNPLNDTSSSPFRIKGFGQPSMIDASYRMVAQFRGKQNSVEIVEQILLLLHNIVKKSKPL